MTGCTGKVHGQQGKKKGGRHGDGDPAALHSGQGWLSAVTGRTGKVHGQHGKKDGDMAGRQGLRCSGDVGCQHNVCQHQPHAVPILGHRRTNDLHPPPPIYPSSPTRRKAQQDRGVGTLMSGPTGGRLRGWLAGALRMTWS